MVVFLIHTHSTTLASARASKTVPKHELTQENYPHPLTLAVVAATKTRTRKPCDTPHVCFDQRPETQ